MILKHRDRELLRENGEIVRVGSRKAGHWLVNELVKDKG